MNGIALSDIKGREPTIEERELKHQLQQGEPSLIIRRYNFSLLGDNKGREPTN